MLVRTVLNRKLLTDIKMDNIAFYTTFAPVFLSGLVVGASTAYILFRRKNKITEDVLNEYHEENFEVSFIKIC